MSIDELIAALESATEGSRELDAEIQLIDPRTLTLEFRGDRVLWASKGDPRGREIVPRYTASIDCALTLVPDGWGWFVERIEGFASGARVWLPAQRTLGLAQESFFLPEAKAPALGLCICALKARAALAEAHR